MTSTTNLPAAEGRAQFTPASRVLLTLAAATLTIAGLYFSKGVIAPLAVAALVVMVSHPIRHPLQRRGVPSPVATAAVIVMAYLILIIMGVLLIVAVAQFVNLLPQYADQFTKLEDQLVPYVQKLGLDTSSAQALIKSIDPQQLLGLAGAVSSAVLGAGTAFFFVLAYIVFMAADASGFGGLVTRFADTKSGVIETFTRYSQAVRTYLAVNTVFGAIVAIIDGIVLIAIGLPAPLLWVILAFVTNYIPNIGFVIALIPPAMLALLTGGWTEFFIVVIAYCVINMTMQTFIQPKFVSDAVRLSLTLTFFSVVFWSIVLGPVGAIMAIPATLLLRALLLESDPEAFWARWLTGDQVELPEATTDGPPPADPDIVAPPEDDPAGSATDQPAAILPAEQAAEPRRAQP